MATEVTIGPEGQERGTGARTGVWNRGGPGGQVGGGGGDSTVLPREYFKKGVLDH